MNSTQPENLDITKRDINFEMAPFDHYYFDGNPYKTHFMNALSSLFPIGEGQFIKSVMQVKNAIQDELLLHNIQNFIGQEGIHSREHRKFNEHVTRLGYDLQPLDDDMQAWAKKENKKSFQKQLAKTVCLEHFTAIIADFVLQDDAAFLKDMTPSTQKIWLWHAAEEIEHKAVAFDVYQKLYNNNLLLKLTMIEATYEIMNKINKRTKYFLKKDNQWNRQTRRQGFQFKWGKNGIFRSIFKNYMHFFKPGFHPWQENNLELTQGWEFLKMAK